MDMDARNQYPKVLQGKYFMAKSLEEKSLILNECCRNTQRKQNSILLPYPSQSFSNTQF